MNLQLLSDIVQTKSYQAVRLAEELQTALGLAVAEGVISSTVARVDLEMFSSLCDSFKDYSKYISNLIRK